MYKGTILSVDNDCKQQNTLQEYLGQQGYQFIKAETAANALEKIKTAQIDIILLDIVLPNEDGLSLLTQFKQQTNAIVIVLTGEAETIEKIICLEMGADDYVTRPVDLRELEARIKAVTRRAGEQQNNADNDRTTPQPPEKIEFGDGWVLDRTQHQVTDPNGKIIDITTSQFELLEIFINAPNRALTREHLFDLTHHDQFEIYDRAIDIQIARLRKKLGDTEKPHRLIKSVRGVGYMFCGKTKAA